MLWLAILSATHADAARSPSGQTGATTTALVGLVGLLLGSLVAGGFRLAGDKSARRADSQRAALYDLQRGAFRLRRALSAYGRAQRATPDALEAVTAAVDDANGKLDLLTHRILCDQVREKTDEWRSAAQAYWLGDPAVVISEEDAAWLALHEFVGAEIRRFDS